MQHQEITSQLQIIPKIYNDFKKFESQVGRHKEQKAKMQFGHYLRQIINFNTDNNGTLQNDIINVSARLGSAKPDFHSNGLSRANLERYSLATGGKSERMEAQLRLAKLLEVKALFKDETDIFKPQNITRVEQILKEMK